MCVRRSHVCTMTHRGLLGTLLGSRSTLAESMARRSGSVKSAQNVMQFNQTGKPTLEFVAQESIDVIAALFSLGKDSFTTHRAFC
ncbi:hypothetical protein OIU77_005117, partial [Salix suchowensis]